MIRISDASTVASAESACRWRAARREYRTLATLTIRKSIPRAISAIPETTCESGAAGGIRTPNPRSEVTESELRSSPRNQVGTSSKFMWVRLIWHHLKANPWACRRRPLLDQASRSTFRSSVDHPAPSGYGPHSREVNVRHFSRRAAHHQVVRVRPTQMTSRSAAGIASASAR